MNNPHKFIQSTPLANLYDAITTPPPSGDDLLMHAENCAECKTRIKDARKHDIETLSSREKIELDLGVRWVKHQLEERSKT